MNKKNIITIGPLGKYTIPSRLNRNVYLDRAGSVNVKKVTAIARRIEWLGCNSVEEIPFWPHEGLKVIVYGGRGSSWFLDEFFDNWQAIAAIYYQHGLRLGFYLFDLNGIHGKTGIQNPWNIPFAGDGGNLKIGNFFLGEGSLWLRKEYTRGMVNAFAGTDVSWRICYNPHCYPVPRGFIEETVGLLVGNGVKKDAIRL